MLLAPDAEMNCLFDIFENSFPIRSIFHKRDLGLVFEWRGYHFKKYVQVARNKFQAADTHTCSINLFQFVGRRITHKKGDNA
jgi:hypothetical protein